MTQTETRVLSIIRDHFGRSSYPGSTGDRVEAALSLDTCLDAKLIDDLRLDSLDLIELAMALEEDFGVELPDVDLEPFGQEAAEKSIRDLAALVDGKMAGRVAA